MSQMFALLFALSVQPTPADDLFFARGTGGETVAQVFEHNLLGPGIQLGLLGHSVRGRAFGAKTNLAWDADHVSGQVAGARVDLKYREADGRLVMNGIFAGNVTYLEVSPAAITGHIGEQRLALAGTDGVFTSDGFQIEIPEALRLRQAGERAAVLPLLLATVTRPNRDEALLFHVTPPEGWPSQERFIKPSAFPYLGGSGGPMTPVQMEHRHH